MGKISTYAIDGTPTITDKVIGTDVSDSNITKNYTNIIRLFFMKATFGTHHTLIRIGSVIELHSMDF